MRKNNFQLKIWIIAAAFLLLAAFGIARADFNGQINFQGKLTDTNDLAVSDDDYNMEFKLYATSSGGTALWTETATGTDRISVTSGLFSHLLGSISSLSGVDFNQTLWLGVNIGGTADTPDWDGEMTPRKKLGAVPAAFESKKLGGKLESAFATLAEDETVTGAWDFNNILSISVSTSSTALTVTQSDTGTIVDIKNATGSVFTIANNGNITVAGDILSATTTAYSLGSETYKWQYIYSATSVMDYFKMSTGASSTYVLTSDEYGVGTWQELAAGGGDVSGSGTPNYLAKWTDTTALSTSTIYDNGTFVGIATSTASGNEKLTVYGNIYGSGNIIIGGTATTTNLAVTGTTTLGSATSTPTIFTGYIQSNIIPYTDNTYTLGASNYRWANIYAATGTFGNTITIGTNTIQGSATTTLFTTGNANQFVLGADGNVGIGTTAPGAKLDVEGNVAIRTAFDNWDSNYDVIQIGAGTSFASHHTIANMFFSDNAYWDGSNWKYQTTDEASQLWLQDGKVRFRSVTSGTADANITWTTPFTIEAGASDNSLYVKSDGNVGIGRTAPAEKLEVAGAIMTSGSQTANTGSSGKLDWTGGGTRLISFGADADTAGTFTLLQRSSDGSPSITSMFVDSAGNVGIGTTTPATALHVYSTDADGQLRLAYDGTKYLNIKTDSAGLTTIAGTATTTLSTTGNANQFILNANGTVSIGTTTASYTLAVVNPSGVSSVSIGSTSTDYITVGDGAGKIYVDAWDPLYNIKGSKYSTYGVSMTGIKEETTGIVSLIMTGDDSYSYVIDFNEAQEASDLWIFYQVTDFGENWKDLTVLLSGEGQGQVWYEKNPAQNQLIIYGESPMRVSYRLTSPKFNWYKYLNVSENGTITGVVVEETINDQYTQSTTTDAQVSDDDGKEESLFEKFVSKVKEALGSLGMFVENGIARLQEVIVDRITTKKLCIEDVCVTKTELQSLLQNAGINQPVSQSSSEPGSSVLPDEQDKSIPEEEPAVEELPAEESAAEEEQISEEPEIEEPAAEEQFSSPEILENEPAENSEEELILEGKISDDID